MDRDSFSKNEKWTNYSEESSRREEKRVETPSCKKPGISINIILFILTIGTTLLAGALQQGVNPLQDPSQIVKGLPFSAALLFILLAHVKL